MGCSDSTQQNNKPIPRITASDENNSNNAKNLKTNDDYNLLFEERFDLTQFTPIIE